MQKTSFLSFVHTRPVLSAVAALYILALLLILGQGHADSSAPSSDRAPERHRGQNDTLLLYAYHETRDARKNLQFFVNHALHDKMDFIFIINGANLTVKIPDRPNIKTIHRKNNCYDIGAHAEVLQMHDGALKKRYKNFILMNASVRGPFLPAWAQKLNLCWSDIYLNYLDERTKLVGISATCAAQHTHHIQSMLMILDRKGLEILEPALNCKRNFVEAVLTGEVKFASMIRDAGYDVEVAWSARKSKDYQDAEDYWGRGCPTWDCLYPLKYYGMDVHPYDTIFVKVNRTTFLRNHIPTTNSPAGIHTLETLTKWADESKYSSYDHC